MGARIGTHTLDQGGGTGHLGPREAGMMFGAQGAGPVEGMLGSFSFLKPVTCSVPSEWPIQGQAKDEKYTWNRDVKPHPPRPLTESQPLWSLRL